MKINGEYTSEFVINSYIAADFGVPVVFISGDKMLCEKSKQFNPSITTVAVKEGDGGATVSINPDYACDLIKEKVKEALKNINECKINIPNKFEVEINYKEHSDAKRASYFPGVTQIGSHTVKYTANNVKELTTTRMFIL
jgi:D-amino peptidase